MEFKVDLNLTWHEFFGSVQQKGLPVLYSFFAVATDYFVVDEVNQGAIRIAGAENSCIFVGKGGDDKTMRRKTIDLMRH